jgi:hypothetical protein
VFDDDQPASKTVDAKAVRGDTKVVTDVDLSAEIIKTVTRASREQVTCRRVKEDHYRCNWWMPQSLSGYDNPGMAGLMVTTNRISRSSFLRVKRAANGGLEITDISGDRSRR